MLTAYDLLSNKQLTGSSFINHCIDEEGCDLPDVQLIFNVSPIWYWLCSPLMCGPSRGKSVPFYIIWTAKAENGKEERKKKRYALEVNRV